jgi:hypothetical protein
VHLSDGFSNVRTVVGGNAMSCTLLLQYDNLQVCVTVLMHTALDSI